jgi:hypothetical protein
VENLYVPIKGHVNLNMAKMEETTAQAQAIRLGQNGDDHRLARIDADNPLTRPAGRGAFLKDKTIPI